MSIKVRMSGDNFTGDIPRCIYIFIIHFMVFHFDPITNSKIIAKLTCQMVAIFTFTQCVGFVWP